MADRNRYFVSPDGDNWKVTKEGGSVIGHHRLKKDAVRAAIDEAHANPPSQVLVQGQDGQFQTEWTYGQDPYPPPG
jgi:hypothetical protein